jgi:hypothetical protein
MEFTFKFPLLSGTEAEVTAEVTEKDTLLGLTFPIGCKLEEALTDAIIQLDEIEDRAQEIYRERRRENRESA